MRCVFGNWFKTGNRYDSGKYFGASHSDQTVFTKIYEIPSDAQWVEDNKNYYLTITDESFLENDNPIVDICADDNNNYFIYEKNFSNIFRIQTLQGYLKLWSRKNNPGEFKIQVKVVRDNGWSNYYKTL